MQRIKPWVGILIVCLLLVPLTAADVTNGSDLQDNSSVQTDIAPQPDTNFSLNVSDRSPVYIPENETVPSLEFQTNETVITNPLSCVPTGASTILSVLTEDSDQVSPSIWGDTVVWEDHRWMYGDIYSYNLITGEERRITGDPSDQTNPDIWGDWVVYEDNRNGIDSDIFAYNISSGEEFAIATDPGEQVDPHISQDWIVWGDTGCGYEKYDVNYCAISDMQSHTLSNMGQFPSIYGDLVVWEDWRDGNGDIYSYNLLIGEERQITSETSDQGSPVVYGNYVAYFDYREGIPQVWIFNLTTGEKSQLTFSEGGKEDLTISGDLVAYTDGTGFEYTLTFINLSLNCTEAFQGPGTGSQHHPSMQNGRLVYDGNPGGYSDIYLHTFGTLQEPLSASFLVNSTQGPPPLDVQFLDASTGVPTGWWWDFGDSTNSNEENPVHSYRESGTYTVTYWIFNPTYRDAVRKEGEIVVGCQPKAQISADHDYGPVPFTVQFSDLSIGQPDTWLWDFGDGSNDTSKNPIHSYTTPGVYNVTLFAANAFGSNQTAVPLRIHSLPSRCESVNLAIPGLDTIILQDKQFVSVNTSILWCSLETEGNCSILRIIPPVSEGLGAFLIYGENASSFWYNGDFIEGYSSTAQIVSESFSIPRGDVLPDTDCVFNFSVMCPLVSEGEIYSIMYEGATPEDFAELTGIAITHNYEYVKDAAYTVVFEKKGSLTGPASLTFGVSADWLEENGWGDNQSLEINTVPEGGYVYVDSVERGRSPVTVTGLAEGPHLVEIEYSGFEPQNSTVLIEGVRESVGVMRIGDDGQGDLLPVEFLYHDPATNMDYFAVSSPEGLSRFSLVTLGKSGNIFQMIYLEIQKTVSGGSAGGGGGGGYSGGGGAVASEPDPVVNPTPVQNVPVAPKETIAPVSGADTPSAAARIAQPAAADTPAGPAEADQAGESPVVSTMPFTMSLLKNLSIVFLVFFVTIVLYVRWKRSGGGEGNG